MRGVGLLGGGFCRLSFPGGKRENALPYNPRKGMSFSAAEGRGRIKIIRDNELSGVDPEH